MTNTFDPLLTALVTFADHVAPDEETSILLTITTTTGTFEGALIGYAQYLKLYAERVQDHPAWVGSAEIARLVKSAQDTQYNAPPDVRAQLNVVCFQDVSYFGGPVHLDVWSVQADTIIGWRWGHRT